MAPRTFFFYVLIGFATLAADLFTLAMLLHWHVLRELAVACGFGVGMVVQFSLNRQFNFRSTSRPVHSQLFRYFLVTGVNLALTIAIVDAMSLALKMPPMHAKLASLFITLPVSYYGNARFTFR